MVALYALEDIEAKPRYTFYLSKGADVQQATEILGPQVQLEDVINGYMSYFSYKATTTRT